MKQAGALVEGEPGSEIIEELLSDGAAANSDEVHAAALETLAVIGEVRTSADVIKALSG